MKDVQGREYDGWTIRRKDGQLDAFFFERTKTAVIDHFQGVRESRASARRRLKRWGFTIVKVRLVEVKA